MVTIREGKAIQVSRLTPEEEEKKKKKSAKAHSLGKRPGHLSAMDCAEISLGVLWVILDGWSAWVPVCRADFSVFFCKLEGVNEAECLVY